MFKKDRNMMLCNEVITYKYTGVVYGIIVFGISTVAPMRECDSALRVVSWQLFYSLCPLSVYSLPSTIEL